jgi:EAL domain-containing protein (putative c-di-GMP-specific phosphodiesterase class I)
VDIQALLDEPARCELVAQPIIDLKRGVVAGYEALSRFQLEPRVAPDRVFAEATRRGLGVALEAVVVERALELAERKPANCFLTINVDPLHLLHDSVKSVLKVPKHLGGIVIELTEHRAVDDMKALGRELDGLRARGAAIAVDDAGSGYSGLTQLLALRPQLLKVDRELVTNVHEDTAKQALIQMLGELAGRLDAWLLAEGIETESELSVLRQMRLPLAQGYFLGKPAPPWAEITPAARALLHGIKASDARLEAVRSLVEPCVTCQGEQGWPEAASVALRVSAEGRPLAMRLVIDGRDALRSEHELLRVKPQSPLSAAAQRAMTRSERLRWDPIVCIDESGHFRGIVRMHRLVSALAEGKTQLDSLH